MWLGGSSYTEKSNTNEKKIAKGSNTWGIEKSMVTCHAGEIHGDIESPLHVGMTMMEGINATKKVKEVIAEHLPLSLSSGVTMF